MAIPSTFPRRSGMIGPDSTTTVRRWVALFLRFGIGLSLLNLGLSGYFGMGSSGPGGNPFGGGNGFGVFDSLFSGLPYLAIALGLALILGFLTMPTAIITSFFSLLVPLFQLVQIISAGVAGGPNPGGFGRGGFDSFLIVMMPLTFLSMIPLAALIWLSPLENHPYSVDALIFGQNAIAPPPEATTPEPAPAAGAKEIVVIQES